MTEPPPSRASDTELADLVALRGVRMNQLYQWRAHRDHVASYLMDEYNDGNTDPEPASARLVDLAAGNRRRTRRADLGCLTPGSVEGHRS
ncbi:hypothetical protein [Streptomyces sp. NBC_00046]|uniref:hypothetical protein n=1 Tax=unclassified Streptomyces TaxID=2593676 RepID=UPI00324FB633